MRTIKLTNIEKETLEHCFKNHEKAHVRNRAHCLLLMDENWTVKQLAKLYHVRTRTIYTWLNRWQTMGIVGLMILPGRGGKPQLDVNDESLVNTVKKKH